MVSHQVRLYLPGVPSCLTDNPKPQRLKKGPSVHMQFRLPRTHDTRNRNVNTHGIRTGIAQQVDVGTAELSRDRRPNEAYRRTTVS